MAHGEAVDRPYLIAPFQVDCAVAHIVQAYRVI